MVYLTIRKETATLYVKTYFSSASSAKYHVKNISPIIYITEKLIRGEKEEVACRKKKKGTVQMKGCPFGSEAFFCMPGILLLSVQFGIIGEIS